MQERRNYYRILQVQPDAPVDVIRSNYRTLQQKLRMHPDLGGDERDAATLNLAYQTLRDPKRRAEYDRELLARHSVRVLGQGGAERVGEVPMEAADGGNRRNYYRVLQVQRDASAPIIDSSYRTLREQVSGEALEQVEAAYAVLGDPAKRRAYDTATRLSQPASSRDESTAYSPQAVSVPLREPAGRSGENALPTKESTGAYAPLILQYCAFCKTPHGHELSAQAEAAGCAVCESPLSKPPGVTDSVGKGRDAVRLAWDSEVNLRLDWPGLTVAATVCDFSPHGALVECAEALPVGAIVRLESENVCAVGEVIHRHEAVGEGADHDATPTRMGLKFLTARFEQTRGTFVCAQA
ncbi:MAG: J domain-containing protein [Pseudomonadota bacterium]